MSKWRYFTDEESEGMTADICFKRDRAREYFGFPIVQTSGYRTPERNAELGGAPDSAHVKGMAFDMAAPQDPFMRARLAWALGRAGFNRVEIAPKHFHADTLADENHPSPYVWEGDDK